MTRAWADAKASLEAAARHMKEDYDKRRPEARTYSIGDKVWLETTYISGIEPSKKLAGQRYGPFRITKKVGESAYRLALPREWKAIHPVFNESLISPFIPPEAEHQGRPVHAPQILEEDGEQYEVEKVLDSRMVRGQQQYLIRWKGYTPEFDTWEPEANLKGAERKLKEFKEGTTATTRVQKSRIRGVYILDTIHEESPTVPERLTTGVDYSLPDPHLLRRWARTEELNAEKRRKDPTRQLFNLHMGQISQAARLWKGI